jgi:DNA-binding winged helix-turn-helix (wHTH) protein
LVWEGQIVTESRVRGLVCELRKTLRKSLNLPKEFDPIPNVDKGAWQLQQLA